MPYSKSSPNVDQPLSLYVYVKVEAGVFDALIEHVKKVTGAYPQRVRREAAAKDETQWNIKCRGVLQYSELKRKMFIWKGSGYFWHTEQQTIVYSFIVWPVKDEYENYIVAELNKIGTMIGMPENMLVKGVDVGHIRCIIEIHKTKQVPEALLLKSTKIADVYVDSNEIVCSKCLMVCLGPNCCKTKAMHISGF
ncbi:hypothetical protein GGI23_002635 [Coemansia sp. RSA 2559]|nr:hypothetical protein GGI23_002635 [Coemansia sp. RSA 2559]